MSTLGASADFVIIGGGIVGLSTAMALTASHPGAEIIVLEKESTLASHQTGRNSGVIHSGAYYVPGSLKARYATTGSHEMYQFAVDHDLPVDKCGKFIVAVDDTELGQLAKIEQRAKDNGLEVSRLSPAEIAEREPNVQAVAALLIPITGIIDYTAVSHQYRSLAVEAGARVRTEARVVAIREERDAVVIELQGGETLRTRVLVNCAGLHSDRIAAMAGVQPPAQILPFRGEYFELTPERRGLVKHLVYPVPDPSFPFLGVHFTRGIDGGVHAGPNAVLALQREGYRTFDLDTHDLGEVLRYSGFWQLAKRHWKTGAGEYLRSMSKRAFVHRLRRLVPDLQIDDLVTAPAGVRAQAVLPDGSLVDDFLIVEGERSVHVLNAPSPAATASLPIGRHVAKVAAGKLSRPITAAGADVSSAVDP
ncbi:MAG: hydroxyglutarate oxidase [Mycobacterium sp.]|nr:hydroxyglutarate oxidase [Mycobacterium sp.]